MAAMVYNVLDALKAQDNLLFHSGIPLHVFGMSAEEGAVQYGVRYYRSTGGGRSYGKTDYILTVRLEFSPESYSSTPDSVSTLPCVISGFPWSAMLEMEKMGFRKTRTGLKTLGPFSGYIKTMPPNPGETESPGDMETGSIDGELTLGTALHNDLVRYQSRSRAGIGKDSIWRFLYLSVVTITTLGYGDLTPVTTRARLLVAFEAIYGVIMMGLFVGFAVKVDSKRKNDI
jgi:hypothetical protein